MRRALRPGRDPIGGTPQEPSRPLLVAPLRVCDADSKLRQATPEIALGLGGRLPRCFEHLMRAERAPVIQKALGLGQRRRRWQGDVLGYGFDATDTVRQWPAVVVARASVARTAGRVAISLDRHTINCTNRRLNRARALVEGALEAETRR